jgi:hypothetical protein
MINMFKKKPILQYESAVKIYPNILIPAKNNIPEWYKEIPVWKNNEIFTVNKGFNVTVKHCMPFLDSLITGYLVVLPNDIYIKNNNGLPLITWNKSEFPPLNREEPSILKSVPFGHSPIEFVWQFGVANAVPKNYSMLITHPLNRYDLPFTTLSGIVDGGLVMNPKGKIPFFIKEGFEGIIPQGTPIAQIIPFRQENWESVNTKGLLEKSDEHGSKTSSLIYGWYKKTFWTRKKYN